MKEVVKKEIIKLLDAGIIYPIEDSPWISLVNCVPKKGGMTVVTNKKNGLVLTRTVAGWRVCIDYRKLNEATRKDHFPLSFMDQMLERLAGNKFFCFLDGFSGYFHISIEHADQKKTTCTYPYGTYAYKRMPFGLCNAPTTFQSPSYAKLGKVSLHGDKRNCAWPQSLKCMIRGRQEFYHRFIKYFSKISRPMTKLLKIDSVFDFNEECIKAFKTLKEKLTNAPIMVSPDWSQPFELMCDASNFGVGAVLRQREGKHFLPIHFASKTLNNAQLNYMVTEKELLAVVFVFDKFRSYLVLSKTIVFTDHSALKYLFAKQDAKSQDIDDNFPDETLMNISTSDEEEIPWFADFVNYLVGKILRKGLNYAQRCKFFSELKHYFWDEPYLFKLCPARMIRRCVHGSKTRNILDECHHGPTRGHYGPFTTAKKVFDAGFYLPIIFKEAHTFVQNCDACQRSGSLSRRDEMPKKTSKSVKYSTYGELISWDRSLNLISSNTFLLLLITCPNGQKLKLYPPMMHELEKRFLQLHELDELRLQAYENFKLYKARTKAYHDKKIRTWKEFKAGDKVLLFNSKYKFKALKIKSNWYGPFMVKHGFPSEYVELYDKHGGSFIVNGHRVKLYHDGEQLNELSSEEIHLMCEKGKMKAILFMAPFPNDYRKIMSWVTEKPFIYSIMENTCNEAKLYDLDETGKGIVKGNILYIKEDPSEEVPLEEKLRRRSTSPADESLIK
ncbi:reverse transcriptase domain-containing protein [Tanacetum coccineum]